MPSKGYQTLTLKSTVFAKLIDAYEKRKRDLVMEDIKSYTAYAQKLLVRAIEEDTLEGRFVITNRFENRVVVKDYFKMKETEVLVKGGKLYCELDESSDCEHVGFVLSDPSVVKRAKEIGVKMRKGS